MGKGQSKPKVPKKKKDSSVQWLRFGSIVTIKSKLHGQNQLCQAEVQATSPQQGKHLDVGEWLKALELQQYEKLFDKFEGVEDLLDHSEADIKSLGVKISSHRAKIMTSLTGLRCKYYGGYKKREPTIRHSVAVDNSRTIQQKDTLSDLKTVTEAIQSKSLNNLIMEPCADPSMDAAALKKALEWELSLDSRDLRSHAWYHGAIPRHRAEDIVREEGGFLVRDHTTQPGNYVLTCRTKIQPLHFVINKLILQPDTVYERVQYQFEDDTFDTIPDLITFYVGSGKPITAASGAKIRIPKNRLYPLSFYAIKYPTPMLNQSRLISPATTPVGSGQFRYNTCSPLPRELPPRLPSKKQRSQSLTPSEVNRMAQQEKCNSADGVIQSPLMTRSAGADGINPSSRFSTHSLPRGTCAKLTLSPSSNTLGRNGKPIHRITSDPTLSPCAERRFFGGDEDAPAPDSPPPKPSRLPSIMRSESKESDECKHVQDGNFVPHGSLQRVSSYHASGSDSGNGSGDSALSSAAGDTVEPNHRNSGVVIKNPRYHITTSDSTMTLKNFVFDYAEAEKKLMEMPTIELDASSRIDLDNFHTLLLPVSENKPLDAQALRSVKMMLKDSGSRILANHLTRADFDLVFGKDMEGESKFGRGIELCTLPHGHQFRLDLIERTECLKLLVAVTILTCQNESDRAEMLNKWIEVAIDTKTALGNLFGFCGIMLGLCLPQIEKLNTTWHMLRQKHTDSAFNFEAKLRPTLKSMNSCSNPQAPNTTIPHLAPLALLLERCLEDFLQPTGQTSLSTMCLSAWEANTQDFGLSTLLAHLDCARKSLNLSATYQRNAAIVLGEARLEELISDMFRTEFMLKFLWGSKGATAPSLERHMKFEQILNVMSTSKHAGE